MPGNPAATGPVIVMCRHRVVTVRHPGTTRLLAREQWTQRSPEWYAVRRELLTASDAAAALDIKPFASYRGSPRAELLAKKMTRDLTPLSNMFVVHGQKYEEEARALACQALGETVADVGLVRHETLPWLAASPDGVTDSGKLVEIKCPLKRDIVPGHVPGHYYPQLQVQMEVCDVDATIFVQYKPPMLTRNGLPFLDVVVVERDRQWFRRHQDILHAFWLEFMDARRHVPAATGAVPAAGGSVTCALAPNPYW